MNYGQQNGNGAPAPNGNGQPVQPDVVYVNGGRMQGMMLPEAAELVSTVDQFAKRIPWWVWFGLGAFALHYFGKNRKGA